MGIVGEVKMGRMLIFTLDCCQMLPSRYYHHRKEHMSTSPAKGAGMVSELGFSTACSAVDRLEDSS